MGETTTELAALLTAARKELALLAKRCARAERDRDRYARALVELSDRPHGVMRPKWLLDFIAAARHQVRPSEGHR